MLPFVLYFVTGVVTGFHVYALLSFVIYGVPVNPLELVSLLGSFCLLIAAYGSLFRPRAAGRLALIACLAMWCFYAPAIANFVRARVRKPGRSIPIDVSTLWCNAAHRVGARKRQVLNLDDAGVSSNRSSGSRHRLFCDRKLPPEARRRKRSAKLDIP